MAELKTVVTDASVDALLDGVDERRQADCRILVDLMRKATHGDPT